MGHWDRIGLGTGPKGLRGRQTQGRVDPVAGLQLADRVLAMPVDGARLDAQLAGDLLGVQVRVDEAQTFALAFRQLVVGS